MCDNINESFISSTYQICLSPMVIVYNYNFHDTKLRKLEKKISKINYSHMLKYVCSSYIFFKKLCFL